MHLLLTLSAPSLGDDLRLVSAIGLRSESVRGDLFLDGGCDVVAVTIRLRVRCLLR